MVRCSNLADAVIPIVNRVQAQSRCICSSACDDAAWRAERSCHTASALTALVEVLDIS